MGVPEFSYISSMQDQLREYYARKILAVFPDMVDSSEIQFGNVYDLYIRMVNEGLIAETDLTPKAHQNALTGWWHVDGYGAKNDDTTDSRAAIDQAVLDCSAAGGGIVYIPTGNYVVSGPVTPRSNVTISGPGASLRSSVNGNIFYARSVACKDFTLDGITFTGTVNSFPTVPTRARTTSGNGTVSAFQISGDTDPDSPGGARIENITIRDCKFRNISGLPLLLKGVRGKMDIHNNEFRYTMDVGFVAYEEGRFVDNYVYGSADNGVSFSRGGRKITVTGNTFENCCYNLIFIAGFLADKGPQNFTVTGNVGINCGNSGVYCDAAPKYGNISGNTLVGGYFRGPVDGPTDGAVCGIFIGGYPTSDRANPTDYGEGFTVGPNVIRNFPRAGVYGTSLRNSQIQGNLCIDIGTQFMADGVTTISAADQTQNVGILIDNATTSDRVTVAHNIVIDTRVTPYCNWGVTPVGSSHVNEYFNDMVNCRNAYNLIETGPTRNINYGSVFQQNTKHTLGGTAGSNAGTGTIAGFDINGAAGSTRRHRIQTNGSDRWQYGGSGTAESGANVGTNFRINAYDDTGVFIKTMVDITRDSKLAFLGASPVSPPTLPAVATDLASAITLANANRAALIAYGLAQ
jgi:hypothetical protein